MQILFCEKQNMTFWMDFNTKIAEGSQIALFRLGEKSDLNEWKNVTNVSVLPHVGRNTL